MLEKIGIVALICYVLLSIIAFVFEVLWLRERDRRRNAEREVEELKEAIASEKHRTRELKDSNDFLMGSWKEAQNKLDQAEMSLFDRDLKIINLEADVKNLYTENHELMSRNYELKDRIGELEEGLEKAVEQRKCYEEDYYIENYFREKYESECEHLKEVIRELIKENTPKGVCEKMIEIAKKNFSEDELEQRKRSEEKNT